METADEQHNNTTQVLEPKRPGFFQRLRKSFTQIFRRRSNRKRNKSDPEIIDKHESAPNPDEVPNLVTEDPKVIENEPIESNDSTKLTESNFKPPAKVPLLINDFTSELKQSLKLRSRKIEEGEKSPTEALKQIEGLRTLSSIVDEEKGESKIETETKTFEEKLALFESQISGGSGSVPDTLKRTKSEEVEGEEEEGNRMSVEGGEEYGNRMSVEEGSPEFVGMNEDDVVGETKYTIDIVSGVGEEMEDGDKEVLGGSIEENFEVSEHGECGSEKVNGVEEVCEGKVVSNGNVCEGDPVDEMDVSGFVNQLICNASESVESRPDCGAALDVCVDGQCSL